MRVALIKSLLHVSDSISTILIRRSSLSEKSVVLSEPYHHVEFNFPKLYRLSYLTYVTFALLVTKQKVRTVNAGVRETIGEFERG